MLTFPFVPPLVALSTAFIMMVLVAAHAEATRRSAEPPSRKRIRLANAVLMMLTLPLLAVGLSLLDPRLQPREWALVWIAGIALLIANVTLAVLDTFNTLRLMRAAQKNLRRELHAPIRVPRGSRKSPALTVFREQDGADAP